MSRPIPPLFHWSPTANRRGIERLGLVPGRPSVTHSIAFRAPYVCLADDPWWAWQLSGAIVGHRGQSWDLWQVTLGDGHKIKRVRSWDPDAEGGRRYHEWRVFDRIYKRGVWLVGTREIVRPGR